MLSGGERRRVAIARLVLERPQVHPALLCSVLGSIEMPGHEVPFMRAKQALTSFAIDCAQNVAASHPVPPLLPRDCVWGKGIALSVNINSDTLQIILMDEPTNHLDCESVAWLERFLAGTSHATSPAPVPPLNARTSLLFAL